jgi:plastocyanin domain-containing protein
MSLRIHSIYLLAILVLPVSARAGDAPKAEQTVSLSVTEEGFTPAKVTVKKGEPVRLVITRKTDNTCATSISIPDYNIKQSLPLNQPAVVTFTPKKTGDIKYACGMGMEGGVLTVQ